MFYTSSPGDGRSAILKIINIIMNKALTLDDVEFSLPSINSDITKNRNSKVSVVFKGMSGFVGSRTIYYNRIHIGSLPALTVPRGTATTYHGLITALNSTYNLRLSPSDIEEGPIPDVVSENVTVTLPITNNSYLYYDTSEVVTDPFAPVYSIFKPSHTLLSYYCNSFDRYGEYSDNDGGLYSKLIQTNSYECGYEDGSIRITLIPPASMSILEEETSDVFTLNLTNSEISTVVTVTVTSPGLDVSQTTFVLDQINDVETFTVSSNNPGTYEIVVSNSEDFSNPLPVYFTVIDRYNTNYGLVNTPPLLGFETFVSETFTIQGYAVDPDEPVTVNIQTSNGLVPSVSSVQLTFLEPIATFTLLSNSAGYYSIGFTNNRGLANPDQLIYLVRPNVSLSLTPPVEPVLEDRQSDLFIVTLQNGDGPLTITPEAIGAVSVVPTSFIVTPAAPTGSFRVTYVDVGPYVISISNSDPTNVNNPSDYEFTVLPQPEIVVIAPIDDIYSGVASDNFSVQLIDGYKPVTVTITSNTDSLSTTTLVLTPSAPLATFTVTDSMQGDYFVEFSNNQNYTTTERIDFTILRTLVPEVQLQSPGLLNLEVGETSGNFTVTLSDHPGPTTVTITTTSGLESSETTLVLDSTNPSDTFTVVGVSNGAKSVSLTNNSGVANPSPVAMTIRAADSVELTVVPAVIRANTLTDTFTVELINPYVSVTVTPTSPDGTFTPSSVVLSVATPTATFRGTFVTEGPTEVTLGTSPSTPSGLPVDITVLEQVSPELTLTGPSGTTYTGDETGNFTATLLNGQSDVTVTIVTETDSASAVSFVLTPAAPTYNFRVTDAQAGVYNVSITNNAGISNPTAVPVTITADPAVLSFDAPAIVIGEAGEASGNFTVSGTGLVRSVLVVPASTGTNTFSPAFVLLTPGSPSQTFTITSEDVGSKTISLSNNRALANPASLNYEFTVATTPVITVTPNNGTTVQEDSAPISFTVAISNPSEETTITIFSWGGSGLSTSTVVLSASNLSDDFTISPNSPGGYNLVFTNDRGLNNPANIPIIVTAAPSLVLSRTGSGNVTRDEEVTFTVTLLNPQDDVEITPYSEVAVTIGDYIPPMTLTSSQPSGTFTVKSDIADIYTIGVTNNADISNPATVDIEVINGSVSLTVPSTALEANVESQNFTVTLNDYDFPTIVTINITNFVDGIMVIDPVVSYSTNQMLLNSTNPTGTFTIEKPVTGEVSITLSNNRALVNPTQSIVTFFDDPLLIVLSPLVDRDLVNQTIGGFNVECQSVTEPSTDKLYTDPYKTSVTLYLLFADPVGVVITDTSPANNTVEVFGNAQIEATTPIYGNRGYLSPAANGDYLRVLNVGDDFNFPGDFTFEIDLIRAAIGDEVLIERYHPSNANNFVFSFNGGNQLSWNNNGNILTCSSVIVPATGLVKIAVSRIGSNLRIFVNGILDGEYTNSTDYTPNPTLVPALGLLGRVNSRITTQDFTGRVGKIKITNGVGRFSANYTPESINPNPNVTVYPIHDKLALDANVSDVMLFIDFSGVAGNIFTDISQQKNVITAVGGAVLSTVDPIYGTTVGLFDGGGDYLQISTNLQRFHFPADFTIEMDFKTSLSSKILLDMYKTGITGFYSLWIDASGKLDWRTESYFLQSLSSVNTNSVVKIALSKIGNTMYLFVNGILESQTADTNNYSPDIVEIPRITIGARVTERNTSYDWNGRIGKVKITKGVGRFSANYTPEFLTKLTFIPTKLELTTAVPSNNFNVQSTNVGLFSIGFINYDNVLNAGNRTVRFEKLPTIQLTGGSGLNFLKGVPSGSYTLTLIDATVPVEITFGFGAGVGFGTEPVGLSSGKVVMDENAPTKIFTLLTTEIGNLTFNLSNNKSLTNPSPLALISTYLTLLNILQPPDTHVFLNTTVMGTRLTIIDPNEPTTIYSHVDNLTDDPYAANVSLLLDFNGELDSRTINDISNKNKPITMDADGIKIVPHPMIPDQNIGMYQTVNTSYFHVRASDPGAVINDFVFGTGDFTIEMEMFLTPTDVNFCLMEFRTGSSNGWWIYCWPDGTVRWTSLGTYIATTTTPLNDSKIRVLTISRVSGQIYLFIDGILEATVVDTSDYNVTPTYLAFGNQRNFNQNALYGKGYINYVRITKGVGRYTTNHTPFRIKKLKTTPHTFTLASTNDFRDISFKASVSGNYSVKFKSNRATALPDSINLTFDKTPIINVIAPISKVTNTTENSNEYTVSLTDPSSLPVKITFNLQAGLTFSTGPTNQSAVNEITLDSTNSSSTFTLTASVAGSYSLSVTNDRSITNPITQYHSFVVEGQDPLFLNENDLRLNLNKPEDTRSDLNIFQTII